MLIGHFGKAAEVPVEVDQLLGQDFIDFAGEPARLRFDADSCRGR